MRESDLPASLHESFFLGGEFCGANMQHSELAGVDDAPAEEE
jgi:hypothetical protein